MRTMIDKSACRQCLEWSMHYAGDMEAVAEGNSHVSSFSLLVLSWDHVQKDKTRKTHMARDMNMVLVLILVESTRIRQLEKLFAGSWKWSYTFSEYNHER
jgi:hypothetical protein